MRQQHDPKCCRFKRNIAQVNPKIIYFGYKTCIQDQSIQKNANLLLKKPSLTIP